MTLPKFRRPYLLAAALAGLAGAVSAGPTDHPMFGGTPDRNMVNPKDKLAAFPKEGPDWNDEKAVKDWSAEWVKWKADLGSKAYGGPTVAGGRVYVGTNNQRPRNPERDVERDKQGQVSPIDRGVLMCFDEKTGAFLWQAVHKKMESGRVNDWPEEGVCATPTVEGDRVYYVSNRCTLVCVDAKGFADGNQGFQKEVFNDKTDADVLWELDMYNDLNVFPHNMSAGCPLIVGDLLYVHTANGVDDGHINLPQPNAPSFIAVDKNTGKVAWKSSLPGKSVMHGQWSNPTYVEAGGVKQVVFPGGDGWIYSFTPDKGELIWKFDGNPKDSVYELGGGGTRSDYIGTPVLYDGKLYIGLGQDPEHSTGISQFYCIDPTKKGDISPVLPDPANTKGKPNPNSGVVWQVSGAEDRPHADRDFKFGRTMSTAAIVDGIVYITELRGDLHCLDAKTGKEFWQFDPGASVWGSAYYVDGKVLYATDAGVLYVFKHDPKPQTIDELEGLDGLTAKEARDRKKAKRKEVADKYLLAKVDLDAPVRSTPVVANGVLYVMTEKTLFALKTTK